ncbi:apolipoprotein N-acyltransferase [Yoonia maritima]|uniref:Apolipoprotein N-acyltransferase n=1 Tax=Yoonia maritima TaxID=1435347 RepID=A0A2T0W070_9RHOB|nr:apolipoprotein N-acyltransferase [Yoonia maritima]PRY78206.1 apolipoprotein N-acyltransferase [Yoonia maritima]
MTAAFAGLSRWTRFCILMLTGAIAGLGQAPQDMWFATVFALALVMAFHSATVSARQAAFQSWAFGVGYFAFSLRWIIEPFLVDVARHGWMAPFAIALMAAGAAAFWACFASVSYRFAPRSPLALGAGLVWAELTRSLILTGFPWALLGHIWVPTSLAQLAAYGGPHLLTLVTVIVAWAVFALFGRARFVGVAVLAALVGLGWFCVPSAALLDDAAPTVRLVQPNAPQHQKWDPEFRETFVNRMVEMTGQGDVPDLIVWPETAVPYLLNYVQSDLSLLDEAARGAPLVFGIQRRDEAQQYFNSLVVMGQGGVLQQIYDKRHLVPFGEYIPGGDLLGRFGIHGLATTDGAGFASGVAEARVSIPGIGEAIPLICYEGIFAEELDGMTSRPRFLLLITNDAWFGQAAGPFQHLAQARLRAIEQGLPMVRVANTGVSAMIDPYGRIVGALPLNMDGVIDLSLPSALPITLYARWGDWLLIVVNALLTLGLYALSRRDSD